MKKLTYTMIAAIAISAAFGAVARTSSDKSEISQNLLIFNSICRELQNCYVDSIDAQQSMRTAIDAMLGGIDPYTEYFSADEQEDFTSISSGEFGGIGSIISQRNGRVILTQPRYDSPARRAGILAGDILIAIDGDTLPMGYSTTDATKRLRGKAGTTLRLTIQRPYATPDSIFDIEITRGMIKTNPVPYYGMLRDGIGYIQLTTFNENSAKDVRDAILALKKDPSLKGIILDLRNNGGGLMESAVQIAGNFVPKGTEIVRTKYREKDLEKVYKTTQKPIDTEIPLAIMINGNTASASEIVAGALQDLDRAVIIGERSFGKGLVQSSRPLPFEGILKVTVARYYIPSGRLIQAIDYSHRNPDGSVARIPDSLTNVFQTRAGREVRDGGGITPDVKTETPDYNRLIYNVIADNWSYDYATRFVARRDTPMPPAAEFEITDSIFADFKSFIDPERFNYDRLCESGIKYLREAAESEGYMNDSVKAQFDILEGMLRHDLDKDLDYNSKTLREVLDTEISARYYSEADCAMRALRYDTEVDTAIDVLTDPERYRALLQPAKTK